MSAGVRRGCFVIISLHDMPLRYRLSIVLLHDFHMPKEHLSCAFGVTILGSCILKPSNPYDIALACMFPYYFGADSAYLGGFET